MVSEGASPVLTPEMAMNLGVSGSAFRAFLPFLNPGLSPPPPWEPIQMPPLVTSAIAPGNPLVLSPFPMMSWVAEAAGHGPRDPAPCMVIVQVRSEVRILDSAQNESVTQTRVPLNGGSSEAPSAGAGHPAPLCSTPSGPRTVVPTPATGVTHAGTGDPPPHAPPPGAQMTPVVLPPSGGPQPREYCGDRGPGPAWHQAPPADSCSPRSVYENFRRWKLFKALTRRYLPRTPDTEALSCFLIPVLRTLARLKPTMSLEEGLRRALREWRGKSNFDRMIYYDMAAKFMEFEAEEEMEAQKLQCMNGVQGLPPPAPPRPEPQGAPGPPLGQQPAYVPTEDSLCAQEAHPNPHKLQPHPKTKAVIEIPPEAVQEYMDIMDELLKVPGTGWGAPLGRRAAGRKEQQGEAGTCPEPGLLSYVDELCSKEAFVTKVEAVIHPGFVAHLLSPESQLDLLALAEELEEEEGLTPAQLVEKRLQASQDKAAMKARPQHQVTPEDLSPPERAAGHSVPGPSQGHRPGASAESCPLETDCGHASGPGLAEPTAPTPPPTRRRAFKPAAPAAAPSRKRPLCGGAGPGTAEKTPFPGGHPRVSGCSALTVEVVGPSLPPKRRFQPARARRRKKKH
ncbi:NUT family member 2G-like [Sorex araneus]|uniref:NUT family member 2G-like n=1 Tax=Sorex araneus TaxID=42254 RepID=UPI002433F600|nr:NUT family member 2G-like [Sorex araneus]